MAMIMPDAERAIPAGTTPRLSVEETVAAIVESVTDEPTPARPFWQTEDCPAWCSGAHSDSDAYSDRVHFLASRDEAIELSLHDPWHVPAQSGENRVDGKDRPAEFGPGTVDVYAMQHYRTSAPEVGLSVPRFDENKRPSGEQDIRLTIAEARVLRDRLTAALASVDGTPLDFELGEPVDGATRRSIEHVTHLSQPFRSDVTITSSLLQWVEPGSGPDLEVEVDVASNPDSYTPANAHGIAARLREAADHIDQLADYAEKTNATLGGTK